MIFVVRLPHGLRGGSKNLLAKLVESKTFYVCAGILRHLNDMEIYYLAAQQLNKNLPDIPLVEVECRLRLED